MKTISTAILLSLVSQLAMAVEPPPPVETESCAQSVKALPPASGKRVLFIGDSHSQGPIGIKLWESLAALPGVRLEFYGACGSAPWSWLQGNKTVCGLSSRNEKGRPILIPGTSQTPRISQLMSRLDPDLVILEQGGNMMPVYRLDPSSVSPEALERLGDCQNPPLEYSETQSRKLMRVATAAGARCIWVAPPYSRRMVSSCFHARYEKIRQWAREEGCEFVDSRPYADYPARGGDGLHYNASMGPAVLKMAHAVADHAFESGVCPEYKKLQSEGRKPRRAEPMTADPSSVSSSEGPPPPTATELVRGKRPTGAPTAAPGD